MPVADEGIPGHFEFSMVAFQVGDEPEDLQDSRIPLEDTSYTYERLRERLGGDEGVLVDPRGGEHQVSLREWIGPDLANIRFVLKFRFHPDPGYEDEYQERLKDYVQRRLQD